jgi:chromosomal replication initiation ATPase DnaA
MGVLERRSQEDGAAARLAASVASYALGTPLEEIESAGRGSAEAAFARQIAMYLCHVGFELSLNRVAAAFGRDPTTVAHACRIVEDRREEPQFDLWINALEAMMCCAPPSIWRRLPEITP